MNFIERGAPRARIMPGPFGPRFPTPQNFSSPKTDNFLLRSPFSPPGRPRRSRHCCIRTAGYGFIPNNVGGPAPSHQNGSYPQAPVAENGSNDPRNGVNKANQRPPSVSTSAPSAPRLVVERKVCSLMKPVPVKTGPNGVIIEVFDYTLSRSPDEGDPLDQEVARIMAKQLPSSNILPTTMNVYFQSQWTLQEEKHVPESDTEEDNSDNELIRSQSARARHFEQRRIRRGRGRGQRRLFEFS